MFPNGRTERKNDVVHTPYWLSKKIYKSVNRKQFKNIIDIGSNDGILSNPFIKQSNIHITGVDIVDDYKDNFNTFIHKDYLRTTADDYLIKPELIITNPPFSNLQAYKFIEHTIKLFGSKIPIIAILPDYILNNSNKRSEQLKELNITRIITLDPTCFNPHKIQCKVVFFNINFKNTKSYEYWYKPKPKIKGTYKSIYLNKDDVAKCDKLVKKYNGNFNKMVKDLIENEIKRLEI